MESNLSLLTTSDLVFLNNTVLQAIKEREMDASGQFAGNWVRNGRHHAQLKVEDSETGKNPFAGSIIG